MSNNNRKLLKLLTSSLSRRIVLWVFISVIVIETIILIPSLKKRENELLAQLKEVSATGISVIIQLADPRITDQKLLSQIKKLQKHHRINGGVLYRPDGKEVGTFGEKPELTFADIRKNKKAHLLRRNKSRYDIALTVARKQGEYTFVARLDSSGVKQELYAFFWRIAGLIVIISIFVTAGAWIALNPIVVTPILRLRNDLINAGDAISNDRQTPQFYSTSVKRRDELGEVITAFNQMYRQISEASRHRKKAEAALQKSYQQLEAYSKILNSELEKGRQIQRNFLPDPLLKIPNWEIAAYFKAARQLSGDFYDTFELPCGCVGFVVADVCDKGVGAALFMALFRSLIRIFSGYADLEGLTIQGSEDTCGRIIPASEGQPKNLIIPPNALKAVELTNDYVAVNHGDLSMFATLFFGFLNPATGSLSYINAGHVPLLIVKPSGGVKAQLRPTGPAIGIDPQVRFGIEQTHLEPGDILLGYTDGVTEAGNSAGTFFTVEKLLSLLKRRPTSAAALIDRIVRAVEDHTGKAAQHDDITLLAIRRMQPKE